MCINKFNLITQKHKIFLFNTDLLFINLFYLSQLLITVHLNDIFVTYL